MKDFLGNEFGVGDTIVYPKMSGRSVALVKGTVVKFNESGSVTIQPEVESWNGGRDRSGTTRYIDTRTGKGFDPHAEKNKIHMIRDYGYTSKETGEFFSWDDHRRQEELIRAKHGNPSYSNPKVKEMRREIEAFNRSLQWEQVIWKDYVKVESTVKTVTITRTDNLILVAKASSATD